MLRQKAVRDLQTALQLLKRERDRLENQIRMIEGLTSGAIQPGFDYERRSGLMSELPAEKPKRKKPVWTPEARAKARERMKRYWAERAKAE